MLEDLYIPFSGLVRPAIYCSTVLFIPDACLFSEHQGVLPPLSKK